MKINVLTSAIAVVLLCLSTTGYSQARFGLKAGLNLASQNYNDFGFEPDTKILPSFMVGVVAEFDFSESLGLGTGLQYQGKGVKYDAGLTDDAKITTNYLQVPIHLQFRKNGFFAAAGPYVAFALSGKVEEGDESEDLDFGSEVDDDFSALDYGVNLELGYEFSSLRITGSYSLGLGNLIPSDAADLFEDASIKNSVIGVAVTYLFGGGE